MNQQIIYCGLLLIVMSTVLTNVEGRLNKHWHQNGHRNGHHDHGHDDQDGRMNLHRPHQVMKQETAARRIHPRGRMHKQHSVDPANIMAANLEKKQFAKNAQNDHQGTPCIKDKVEELVCPESSVDGAQCYYVDTWDNPPQCYCYFTEEPVSTGNLVCPSDDEYLECSEQDEGDQCECYHRNPYYYQNDDYYNYDYYNYNKK